MNHVLKEVLKLQQSLYPPSLSKLLNKTLEDITIQDPKIRYKLFGQKDHYRLYAQCDYIKNLKDIGFEVEVRNISVENMKYGLNPMEDLYICHKK